MTHDLPPDTTPEISRRFRFEREMFASLIDLLPKVLGFRAAPHAGVTLLREPSVGGVIPDLLIGGWTAPIADQIRKINFVEAAVLAAIDDAGSLSSAELSSKLHMSRAGSSRAIANLLRSRLLEARDDRYLLTQSFSMVPCEIVSVELKLSRWRDALMQARNYHAFSHRAYVALDGQRFVGRPEVINQFKDSGIGLLLQFGAELETVVDATFQRPHGPDRFIALRLLAKSPDIVF